MPFSKPLLAAPPRIASGFILVAVLLDMAGFGIALTVLPSLIGRLAGPANAGFINGVFVGVWALVQFAASPLLGALSDRFGRRPLILLSMTGLGLDYVVMALAPNLWWLLAGRIVSGVTASSFSVCYAYVADITPEAGRAAAFGRLGAVTGLGFILGPAIGGLLGAISLRAPFWVAAAFSLANALLGLVVLPESLPRGSRAQFTLSKANPLGSLRLLRSHPELAGLSWTHVLSQFAGSAIASVYVLYVVRRYGWSVQAVGLSLALVGLIVALVQGFLMARVTAHLGERRTLLVGMGAGLVSLALFGLSPVGWLIPLAIVVFGLWGLQGPALMSLMSQRVSETEQGQLQGAMASLTSIADGVGPFVFGAVYSLTLGLAGWMSGIAFLAAASVMAAAMLITLAVVRRGSHADAA
jgi:DHA1 family tetracycline resistance protein-like MFS transporter